MPESPRFPLRLFYDGACSVCSAEMEHYRRKAHEGKLIFIDISDADFDPAPCGFTQEELMAQMHAMDASGRVYKNVDAFWAIWKAFPEKPLYRLLAATIRLPLVHPAGHLAYRLFARYRKYLPKRRSCGDGRCDLHGR